MGRQVATNGIDRAPVLPVSGRGKVSMLPVAGLYSEGNRLMCEDDGIDCAAYSLPLSSLDLSGCPQLPDPIQLHDRCSAVVRISCACVPEIVAALHRPWGYVKTYSVTRHAGSDGETQSIQFGPEGRPEFVMCLIPPEKLYSVDPLRIRKLRKRVLREVFPLFSDLSTLLWGTPLLTFSEWQSRYIAAKQN